MYWPNAGRGNWGKKVIMKNPPSLPQADEMKRVLVSDINGDGLTDIVLVENSQIRIWINQSGIAWSDEIIIQGTPLFASGDDVRIIGGNHLEDGDTALYTIKEGIIVLKKGAIIPNGFTIGV